MISARTQVSTHLAKVGLASALATSLTLGLANATFAQTPPPPSPTPVPLATSSIPTAMYNLQSDRISTLDPLHMEYSAALEITYPVGVDHAAFAAGLTVTPAVPVDVGNPFVNLGGMNPRPHIPNSGGVGIRLRMVPGTIYTLTQPAFGVNVRIGSNPLSSFPAPIRTIKHKPYYYGFLNHPWAFAGFLGGLVYSATDTRTNAIDARAEALATVEEIKESGAGYVRMDFCADQLIGHLTPYATPHWTGYDTVINALAAINVTVLPEIQQHCAPAYMHYNPLGGGNQTMDNPTDYATFASAVASHLRQFPQVTRVELFNEPNIGGGWNPGTPAYVSTQGDGAAPFMKAAYSAIKAANPNLMVVSGALATGGHHVGAKIWLANSFLAGCKLGVCWDEISVHNYRWTAPAAATITNLPNAENRFDIYKDIQNVAVAHGDPKPHVMLTEWGYSSCENLASVCFDQDVQALYLAQGLNLALADPTVDGVTYVNVYNSSNDGPNYFWSNTAIINNDRTPKAAFDVFKQFATGSQ